MKIIQPVINLIYRSAKSGPVLRWVLTPIAGGLFLCMPVLFVLVAMWLDRVLGFPAFFIGQPWHILLGISLGGGGLFLGLWCVFLFFQTGGSPVPFNPPQRLVCRGPYAIVRNPMLSGLFFLLFGLGFCFRSISLVCIFTPLFVILNYLELKNVEEPELEKRLGEQYVEYKRRVPMFVPGLKGDRRTVRPER
ncbi:MAG: isoprenylcysteine carboxylmethyltransferase family protein [Gemmatimonadota bacterium]|nr:isoprenylcysteine carboxylmethyltransferase family protein [Gemmatimonadota bacterium]